MPTVRKEPDSRTNFTIGSRASPFLPDVLSPDHFPGQIADHRIEARGSMPPRS